MELLNRKRLQSQFSRLERHSVDFVREVKAAGWMYWLLGA